ncbi:unnamed protein product [Peronospora destructor]|uniref:t-SNARE coiled-coil homology domain-containing protein n=1 Tax=Peronospora destructor TaxID=86335 RepID=A0AAV0VEY0_9STRA|nr:unnamed protein product [Peronospora destructor]
MRVDVTSRFRELAPIRSHAVSKQRSAFSIEAMNLLSNLVEIQQLLHRVKPQYLLPKRFVWTKGPWMSEEDKDELDTDLVELIKNCSSRIDSLESAKETQSAESNVEEYQKEVVAYLFERLKCIADSAKQMQKKRYQQPFLLLPRLLPECERQDLDALEQKIVLMSKAEATKKQAAATLLNNVEAPRLPLPTKTEPSTSSPRASSSPPMDVSPVKQSITSQRRTSEAQKAVSKTQQRPVFASKSEDLELTEEKDRRFRAENLMLHRHFQENFEDAKKMESKMSEISNLMGQFADKIMEQQTDIELIQYHAEETKSNVTQSNRILEQTQKVGKGYGFMIFCFYMGFSVILHMLHYFNS